MPAGRFTVAMGEPLPLGVSLQGSGANVSVVSETADTIYFCLFDEAGEREIARLPLPGRTASGIRHGFVTGVKAGARYGLRADGPYDPRKAQWFDPAKLLVDPYAKEIDRPFSWRPELAAPRSAAIDTADLVPKAILRPLVASLDVEEPRPPRMIYEINVRAFTRSYVAIPEVRRGTLSALAHPKVISYLRRLGVDTVELLPLAAWIDERHLPPLGLSNAWGYNPVAFMAPDPRLAPNGLVDVRKAVAALHKADIRVILDVVFNHTGESDTAGATLSFRGLDNTLYYLHEADDPSRLINVTGCGNTLAVEREPVRNLILESLRHWAGKGGFDGFRFDLATVLGRTGDTFSATAGLFSAIESDPLLNRLTMIAEPWDASGGGYQLGGFPPRWLEWNDKFRDDVRRFWQSPGGSMGDFATRLAGSSDAFAVPGRAPSSGINYVSAHDGFTLRDLVSYRTKHNFANGESNRDGSSDKTSWNNGIEGETVDTGIARRRVRDVRALLATLFVARGTPLLTAGDEFGRTQGGNNNAYAQDNPTSWLDWAHADESLIEFVCGLIAFRNGHRTLSADRFLTGKPLEPGGLPDIRWLTKDARDMKVEDWDTADPLVLGAELNLEEERLLIWFNRGDREVEVRLPEPRQSFLWQLDIRSEDGATDLGETIEAKALTLGPRSVVVLSEAWPKTKRRSKQADDDLVGRAAAAAGIHEDWWTIGGEHRHVSVETKRALLKAMGLSVASGPAARETLRMLEWKRAARPLPEMNVLSADRENTLRLVLPMRQRDDEHTLELELENGEHKTLTVSPQELTDASLIVVTGEEYAACDISLPALPEGYHRLRLADIPEHGCHLLSAPAAAWLPPELAQGGRTFGLSAHLYALRHENDGGMGDFTTLARYGETTARLGGTYAGIGPLHHLFPTDRGRASPYQASDRRFLDPMYIDTSAMGERGSAFAALREKKYVDYEAVWKLKRALLEGAFARFSSGAEEARFQELRSFSEEGGEALRRHALFEALAGEAGTVDRSRWPANMRKSAGAGLKNHEARLAREIAFRIWMQWTAQGQFAAAADVGRRAGLSGGIYGDLAIGTAPDGGEVWADPARFAAGVSLGAPPDPFAAAGQVWHLTPLSPHSLVASGMQAYREVLGANMRHVGAMRIDHVLGFARQFWVPDGAPGTEGAYIAAPENAFIAVSAIESHRARCMIVGEDLGTVPDGLRGKLNEAKLLSYKLLWFERDGDVFRSPSTYPHLSTACISSHDLPTFLGWRRGLEAGRPAEVEGLKAAIRREGLDPGTDDISFMVATHAMVALSPSALMLAQADDLFEETEPLNVPGTDRERPNWRRRETGEIASLATNDTAARVLAAVSKARPRD